MYQQNHFISIIKGLIDFMSNGKELIHTKSSGVKPDRSEKILFFDKKPVVS